MKAAVLEQINSPLSIQDLATHHDNKNGICLLDYGQVFVRILCAGICGAQLQEIRGDKGDPRHLPHLLGHEGCGIVEEIGPRVNTVKKGDKVVVHWRKGAGCDVMGPVFLTKLDRREVKAGPCTAFAEYVTVSENRVTSVPPDFPSDLGALLGCALSTALATIENETRSGQSILVIGCGGVGLSFILAAKSRHLWPITAVDKNKNALQAAENLGAEGFNKIFDIERTFDIAIDTTGVQILITLGIEALNPSGKFIMVGQPNRFANIDISRAVRMFDGEGKTIKATQAGGFNPAMDIPRYVNMWRSGALNDYPKIIGHRIKLDQINDGIALMLKGEAKGRVMIDFE